MQINVRGGNVWQAESSLAVLGVAEGDTLPPAIAELLEPADFGAKAKQTLLLYPRGTVAPRRLLLVGLGKREDISSEVVREVSALAVRQARDLQVEEIAIGVHGELPLSPAVTAQAIAEGIDLGAYGFWRYRTGLSHADTFRVQRATVFAGGAEGEVRDGIAAGQVTARGVTLARDLVNTPGYAKTPEYLGEEAVALGERMGLSVTVMDQARLTEEGFGGILAVGKGSANEPRFIVMEYGAASDGRPTVCLAGKGLTFDSGGLSLKPADAMETMKSDMGGAAAVFGAMQAVAELQLPLHVVGLVSAAENMPSGTAYRPGDVITTLSGKTVEVLNTDAEGRIILSDALHYAHRYEPDAIIELSTLTGAIIIALGSYATGMMATNQALANMVTQAGEASGERVWQLPLWDEYYAMIKSQIADVKNLGGRPAVR